MSSDNPSQSAVISAFAPLYSNGSTATQNPSWARAAPESSFFAVAAPCSPPSRSRADWNRSAAFFSRQRWITLAQPVRQSGPQFSKRARRVAQDR